MAIPRFGSVPPERLVCVGMAASAVLGLLLALPSHPWLPWATRGVAMPWLVLQPHSW